MAVSIVATPPPPVHPFHPTTPDTSLLLATTINDTLPTKSPLTPYKMSSEEASKDFASMMQFWIDSRQEFTTEIPALQSIGRILAEIMEDVGLKKLTAILERYGNRIQYLVSEVGSLSFKLWLILLTLVHGSWRQPKTMGATSYVCYASCKSLFTIDIISQSVGNETNRLALESYD